MSDKKHVSKKRAAANGRHAQATCSASKHNAMYRDGWKNCWHCGVELVLSFDRPNTKHTGKPGDAGG